MSEVRILIEYHGLATGACCLPEHHNECEETLNQGHEGEVLGGPTETEEGDLGEELEVSRVVQGLCLLPRTLLHVDQLEEHSEFLFGQIDRQHAMIFKKLCHLRVS